MKFALLIDKILHKSFSVIDGKSYNMKTGEPYSFHNSIKNETAFGVISYPFAYGGDFINLEEWTELPKNDYDVIIVSIERHFEKYNIDLIRKIYPNAVVIGTMKEVSHLHNFYDKIVNIHNACDAIGFPCYDKTFLMFPNYKNDVKTKVYPLPQPYNINYLYNNFYLEERNESLFSYIAPDPQRRGETKMFAEYLSDKYSVPLTRKEVLYYPGTNQWHQFIELFRQSTFCINLDPMHAQGHQGVQAAILGIVNIGGLDDSHYILFPDTSTNDTQILEQKFIDYFFDINKRTQAMNYAFEMVNKYYSYESSNYMLEKIIKDVK